jgi:hypothetical protein
MMIAEELRSGKYTHITEAAEKLERLVTEAAAEGRSLHEVEKASLEALLAMGTQLVDSFLRLQGDGNLGPVVETQQGASLHRSEEPQARKIRTIFGSHVFHGYTYARGAKKKVELRPLDARMSLPEGEFSYLLEEFSQYFCVEQAFGKAQQALEKVLGQDVPVDSLERISRRVAVEAEKFLELAPAPAGKDEGELLVLSADGKGVPMIRENAAPVVPFAQRAERRGNRQMAIVAAVYSVDSYPRTAEELVAALFREGPRPKRSDRPRPCHKRMVARFAREYEDGPKTITVPGSFEALSWAAQEVRKRRQPGQTLLRLGDGQEDLWTVGQACLEDQYENVVDILDILHVSSYVWSAARAFCGKNEPVVRAFARERLLTILSGNARGVIRGLRRMATERGLRGQAAKDVATACGYFENNLHRMRYAEYLAAGYPIASGVIEGACRHLVKDRMERSGMRWLPEGAQAMLDVRALDVSGLWNDFQTARRTADLERLYPHRQLLDNYMPFALAA